MPFGMENLEWCGYPMVKNFQDMFIRFVTIHERDGQTHRHRMTAKTALAQHRTAKTVKINGGVECMVYENSKLSTSIWPITAGSNVPSTLGRYASYCVEPSTRYRQMPLCHAAVVLAFITNGDAKMLNNATYFCL